MITNKVNGKIYIGQSIHIERRWKEHKSRLNCDGHINKHLQLAWNKYGEENFIFSVIEECKAEQLDEREIYWISKLDAINPQNGYNLCSGGSGTGEGKCSPFYGKHHTKEAKDKISKANTGKHRTQSEKDHLREIFTGRCISAGTRRRSASTGHRTMSEKTKQRMSNAKKGVYVGEKHPGHKYSEETILQVIDLLKQGLLYREISDVTGVTITQIGYIKNKQSWAYLTKNINFEKRDKNAS